MQFFSQNQISQLLNLYRIALCQKKVYIRDAQGNCMRVYNYIPQDGLVDDKLLLTERNIFGSSRLGVEQVNQIISSTVAATININEENGIYEAIYNQYAQRLGDKRYELSNLPIAIGIGNVLEVVTDRKLAVSDDDITVDYYVADVVSQSDFFPFGMVLPNRNDDAGGDYRYGFQGYEVDDEIKGDGNSYTTFYRQYDPRIAKWTSSDPMEIKFPWQSPYVAFDGNPILYSDPLGGETEDNIGIDRDGNVTFWEIAPGADVLYATDEKGNIKYENDKSVSIVVEDESLLPDLFIDKTSDGDGDVRLRINDRELHYTTSTDKKQLTELFLFFAANTNYEWGILSTTDDKYTLGTIKDPHSAPTYYWQGYQANQVKVWVHSHPYSSGDEESEISHLAGDKGIRNSHDNWNHMNYYTYYHKTGNLYSIGTDFEHELIKLVNRSANLLKILK